MCEMLRKHARRFDYHPNKIIEMLFSFGYRCFTFEGDTLIEFFTMDEQTVQTDFFFLHSEKHKDKIVNYNLRRF